MSVRWINLQRNLGLFENMSTLSGVGNKSIQLCVLLDILLLTCIKNKLELVKSRYKTRFRACKADGHFVQQYRYSYNS